MQMTVVFLFGIAATPVASSALIRYGNVTRAVIFAAVLLAFTSLMHLRLLRHVTDPHLELSDIDPEVRQAALERSAWAGVTYLLAVPLALVLPQPAYAMLVWLVVPFARHGIRAARRDPPLADE